MNPYQFIAGAAGTVSLFVMYAACWASFFSLFKPAVTVFDFLLAFAVFAVSIFWTLIVFT